MPPFCSPSHRPAALHGRYRACLCASEQRAQSKQPHKDKKPGDELRTDLLPPSAAWRRATASADVSSPQSSSQLQTTNSQKEIIRKFRKQCARNFKHIRAKSSKACSSKEEAGRNLSSLSSFFFFLSFFFFSFFSSPSPIRQRQRWLQVVIKQRSRNFGADLSLRHRCRSPFPCPFSSFSSPSHLPPSCTADNETYLRTERKTTLPEKRSQKENNALTLFSPFSLSSEPHQLLSPPPSRRQPRLFITNKQKKKREC